MHFHLVLQGITRTNSPSPGKSDWVAYPCMLAFRLKFILSNLFVLYFIFCNSSGLLLPSPSPQATSQSRGLTLLMAASAGIVVANNYYNQPLLSVMAADFGVGSGSISWVASLTQLGYAAGLFFLLPLGDMLDRRKVMSFSMVIAALAMAIFISTSNFALFLASGFAIGFFSIVPQTLPPIASRIVPANARGQAVGTILSGLLLGIILSRFFGGLIGSILGWRAVYMIAIALMFALLFLLMRKIPRIPPDHEGSYGALMRSLAQLVVRHGKLRLFAGIAALQFGAFSLFWTTLAFHLESMPQHYSPAVVSGFAIIGAVGVIAAPWAGRFADRLSTRLVLSAGCAIMVCAFILMGLSVNSLIWLVPAVVLLDLGMQVNHVTSMSQVLSIDASAGNRLNTVYMVTRFGGGAFGTLIGGMAWTHGGWHIVCLCGGILCALGLALGQLIGNKKPADSYA